MLMHSNKNSLNCLEDNAAIDLRKKHLAKRVAQKWKTETLGSLACVFAQKLTQKSQCTIDETELIHKRIEKEPFIIRSTDIIFLLTGAPLYGGQGKIANKLTIIQCNLIHVCKGHNGTRDCMEGDRSQPDSPQNNTQDFSHAHVEQLDELIPPSLKRSGLSVRGNKKRTLRKENKQYY
jgi:hypothetical protein